MLKIMLIITSVAIVLIITIAAILIIPFMIEAKKNPPSYGIIELKYYVCLDKKLLEGGIFGKGPKLKFPKDSSEWCRREDWQEIDKKTFKMLATEWYGIDWSNESSFWND